MDFESTIQPSWKNKYVTEYESSYYHDSRNVYGPEFISLTYSNYRGKKNFGSNAVDSLHITSFYFFALLCLPFRFTFIIILIRF